MIRPPFARVTLSGCACLSLLAGSFSLSCAPAETAAPAPDAFDLLPQIEFSAVVAERIALLVAEGAGASAAALDSAQSVDQDELHGLLTMHSSAREKRMRNAAEAAAQEMGAGVIGALSSIMLDKEEDSELRRSAALLLASFGTDPALEPLVGALEESDEAWLRRLAAWCIGESAVDSFLLRLVKRLKYETDEECVVWLAGSLARCGNLAGIDGLRQVALSADPNNAQLAASVVAEVLERSETETLLQLDELWSSPQSKRLRTTPASNELRLSVWRKISELSSEHFQLRGVDDARFILSRLGPWAAELVAQALREEDSHLRLHSIQVLERMGSRALETGPALVECLSDARVGHAAAEAIGHIGYAQGRAALEACILAQRDHELRVAAVRALGYLASPESAAPLLAIFEAQESPSDLRLVSAEALVHCGRGVDVAAYLIEQMTAPRADSRGAEIALSSWLQLGAAEELSEEAGSESNAFQEALALWLELAGPHPLLITRQEIVERRRQRTTLLQQKLGGLTGAPR